MPRAASPCSNRLPPRAASGLAKPPSAAKDGNASDAPSIRLLATSIRDSTRFMKTSITDEWLDDTWVRQPEPAFNVCHEAFPHHDKFIQGATKPSILLENLKLAPTDLHIARSGGRTGLNLRLQCTRARGCPATVNDYNNSFPIRSLPCPCSLAPASSPPPPASTSFPSPAPPKCAS